MRKLILLLLLTTNCYAAEFERIQINSGEGLSRYTTYLWRIRVPHGWLVTTMKNSITFYPDEKHEWKI